MNTDGAHISTMGLNGSEVTVIELPWGFQKLDNGEPCTCVKRVATEEGVYSELVSDFWLGYVKLTAADGTQLPEITMQLTCDGNCARNQPCSPMIAQYDAEGKVIQRLYADESYKPTTQRTEGELQEESTEGPSVDDERQTAPVGWWQNLLRKLAG